MSPALKLFSAMSTCLEDKEKTRRYLTIVCLLISMFIAAMDIVIGISIIEKISEDFHSYSKSGWVLSAYTLTSSMFSLLAGRLSLKIGLKSSIVISIIIFQVGSLLSGVCTSMNMLIGSRVISGIGAGGIQSLCYVSVPFLVGPELLGKVNSYFSSCFGLAAFVGCFVGAYLENRWKICYLINIPIGCVPLICFILVFPSTPTNQSEFPETNPEDYEKYITHSNVFSDVLYSFRNAISKSFHNLCQKSFYVDFFYEAITFFDFIEFAFLAIGFTLLLVGLTYGVENNPTTKSFDATSGVIVMLALGGLSLFLALLWDIFLYEKIVPTWYYNKYGEMLCNQLISKRLLTEWRLIVLNLCNFSIGVGYFGIVFYSIQYYLLVFGYSASSAIKHYTCFIASPLSALLAGSINRRTGYIKPILIVCTIIGCVGAGLLSLFKKQISSVVQDVTLVLCAMIYGGTVQMVLLGLQVHVKGYGEISTDYADKDSLEYHNYKFEMTNFTSANSFFRIIGNSLAGVISNIIFDISLKNKVKNNKSLPVSLREASVNEIIDYRGTNFDGKFSPLGTIIAKSIGVVFWVCFGFYCSAFVMGLLSSNKSSVILALSKEYKHDNDRTTIASEKIEESHTAIDIAETV